MHLEPYDEMKSLDEMTRQRLREIEVKVMCYQDDLESGKIQVNPGWTLSEQVCFLNFHKGIFYSLGESVINPLHYKT